MRASDAVAEFEQRFAKHVGAKYAISVSSGTAGLVACMMALLRKPGEKVVTTPLTFLATTNSILAAGGIPIFSDVNQQTFCLDANHASKVIDRKTSVVLGVHLYGLPFDVEGIRYLAENRDITIVEDAAQALGASVKGKHVGILGDLAVFSFYQTKHVSLGEGGMITTNDADLAEKCRIIRSHGQAEKYYHVTLGYNFRLPIALAEDGLRQLNDVVADKHRREEIAKVYKEELGALDGVRCQKVSKGIKHSFYMFPLVIDGLSSNQIDKLVQYVHQKTRIRLTRGYGLLSYQQPFYRRIHQLYWGAKLMKFPNYSDSKCPEAEYLVRRIVELPTDDLVTPARALEISQVIRAGLADGSKRD